MCDKANHNSLMSVIVYHSSLTTEIFGLCISEIVHVINFISENY